MNPVRQKPLTRGEARLVAILEAVSDAVVVIDDRGLVEVFNRAAEVIFGYEASDVLGNNVNMLMPEDHGQAHDQYMADYHAGGEQRVIGHRRRLSGRRKDGSLFPLELTVAEIECDGGRLYAGTCRDITEQLEADGTIKMYATTIEATPDCVAVASPTAELLAINAAGRQTLGLDEDEGLQGMTVADLHHRDWRHQLLDQSIPTAMEKGVWSGETTFLSAQGTPVPMSEVITVSRNDAGAVEYICSIARDLTEIKESERAKADFVEFVSTMSHELRTPLTSIRGALGLITAGVLDDLHEEAAHMVTLAKSNTDRLINLVNDILDFEKSRAGQLVVLEEEVDLLEVVETAATTVFGAAVERQIEIAVESEGPSLTVRGDSHRLSQVFINLLGNAIKFSPVGSTIMVHVVSDGEQVAIEVEDRGIGIPEESLRDIFKPFQQVDSSDRRQVGGTGLGLAIVKGIVEAHGGDVTVESVIGEGSTFTVSIPAGAVQTSDEEVAVPATP